mgnify:FL=1|tara:strand:- start:2752 stop:3231 length:480 start_codon:yes stop_codon:yes gene_type:complete
MEINDIVVLHQANARNTTLDANNDTLTFDIPSTYYTNQRSTVCSISLVDFNFVADSTDDYILVYYDNIGQNQFNSANNGLYLGYGVCKGANTDPLQISNSDRFKVLVNARPTTITLKLKAQGNTALGAAITNAFFVLKFEYANPVDTSEMLLNDYTPTL